jgi:hypothetical protein
MQHALAARYVARAAQRGRAGVYTIVTAIYHRTSRVITWRATRGRISHLAANGICFLPPAAFPRLVHAILRDRALARARPLSAVSFRRSRSLARLRGDDATNLLWSDRISKSAAKIRKICRGVGYSPLDERSIGSSQSLILIHRLPIGKGAVIRERARSVTDSVTPSCAFDSCTKRIWSI